MSVALSDHDDIWTFGNDDDSHLWPNSLTHHIVGGHYGYPYEFRTLRRTGRCRSWLGSRAAPGRKGSARTTDGLAGSVSRQPLLLRLGSANRGPLRG